MEIPAMSVLKDVGVDAIGGWRTAGVGQTYGNGYPLEVLRRWMEKIV